MVFDTEDTRCQAKLRKLAARVGVLTLSPTSDRTRDRAAFETGNYTVGATKHTLAGAI